MLFRISRFSPALLAAAISIAASGAVLAAADPPVGSVASAAPTIANKLTIGEVRKVDAEQVKVTIKHEAIANLDMPAMTMVFKASKPELLKSIKAGDKIEFRAENLAGGFVVTDLKPVK